MLEDYFKLQDLVYDQSTGYLYLADRQDGRALIARGYSGKGVGLNNPEYQDRVRVGPIPRGVWRMGTPVADDHLGPVCISLTPARETQTLGRGGFFIHGDNRLANGSASEGCVILGRTVRDWIGDLIQRGVTWFYVE